MAATDTKPLGRKGDKKVRDALLAALRDDPTRLKRAAEKAWDMACSGDLSAFREIADRIDGKAVQPICGDDEMPPVEANLMVTFVKPINDADRVP